MTTLADLKTQAAALVSDPDMETFTTTDLGYFINQGIAAVSRIAPQRFIEDVDLVDGTLSYPIRGGTGNLVANPSFEEGDETMFDGAYNTVAPGDAELTGGWEVTVANTRLLWTRSHNAKTGLYVGGIIVPAAATAKSLYQNIPVNPGVTYQVSGYHWKALAGGFLNAVRFHTLDSSEVIVTTDAVRHDTTAATPQAFSGSISVPADGTVAYIQVILLANGNAAVAQQTCYYENISVLEVGEGSLVASNSVDQIEVTRVELWSTNFDPSRQTAVVPSAASYGASDSEAGWEYWAGRLTIPYRILSAIDTAACFLRVRGYAPYDRLTSATQVTDLSFELSQAVMAYVRMEALSRLVFERDLFTQHQTRTGNTDVSFGGLMTSLVQAREDWRRMSHELMVLRVR